MSRPCASQPSMDGTVGGIQSYPSTNSVGPLDENLRAVRPLFLIVWWPTESPSNENQSNISNLISKNKNLMLFFFGWNGVRDLHESQSEFHRHCVAVLSRRTLTRVNPLQARNITYVKRKNKYSDQLLRIYVVIIAKVGGWAESYVSGILLSLELVHEYNLWSGRYPCIWFPWF